MVKRTVFVACMVAIGMTRVSRAQGQDVEWIRDVRCGVEALWHHVAESKINADSFGPGLTLEASDSDIFGAGVSVDFKEKICGSMSMAWGIVDIASTGHRLPAPHPAMEWGSQYTVDNAELFLWDWLVEYSVARTRFTPLLVGGVSFIGLSGTRATGEGFNESHGGLVAGAGFRWDITDRAFLKALYRAERMPVEGSGGAFLLHGPSVVFVYVPAGCLAL